jgi:hypothetical protein
MFHPFCFFTGTRGINAEKKQYFILAFYRSRRGNIFICYYHAGSIFRIYQFFQMERHLQNAVCRPE